MDLRTVIEEVLSLVQVDAATRRVRFVFPAGPDLPEVAGDRIHLQQVVLNLVVNAMDAMEGCGHGDHRIEISLGQTDAGFVEVRIADNGPGIRPIRWDGCSSPFLPPNWKDWVWGCWCRRPSSKRIAVALGGKPNRRGRAFLFHRARCGGGDDGEESGNGQSRRTFNLPERAIATAVLAMAIWVRVRSQFSFAHCRFFGTLIFSIDIERQNLESRSGGKTLKSQFYPKTMKSIHCLLLLASVLLVSCARRHY